MSEFHKGKQLQEEGKLEDAIAAYHRALELNSNDFWAHHHMGEVLVKLGRCDEAVTAYRHAIELKPDFSWSYHYLGDALAQQQQWEESAVAFRKAIELNPEHFGTYVGLGNSLAKLGELDEAIAAYRRASDLNPDTDWIYDALANALQQRTQSDLAQAIASYRHIIELNPDNVQAYHNFLQLQPDNWEVWLQLAQALMRREQIEDAIASYRRAIELNPSSGKANYELAGACHRLSIILAEQGLIHEAIACFREAPQRQPSEGEIYENIWKGLNQLGVLHESNPFYQVEINPEDAKNYFMQTSQYRTIILESLTEEDNIFLEKTGISLANLQLIAKDSRVLEEIYINSFGDGSLSDSRYGNSTLSDSSPIKLAQKVDKGFAYYQQSIVETGYVYSVCPVSGRILRSNQSLYIQHNNFLPTGIYRFAGNEVFYFIVGCHHAIWLAIYLPRWELIIRPTNNPFSTDYFSLINELKGGAVGFRQLFKTYISKEDKKEIAAVVGWLGNLGHYFWNDLSGIQHLSDNEILSKVNKFLMGNYNFFNIGEIFPEIPAENIVQIPDRWSLLRTTLENNYFTVRLTDLVIKERLASNIYQAAISRCSQEFLQQLEKAKKHFPLLWIQIRLRYRVWVSQVEGIANIIKALHSDYPNLGVVIVGNWYFTETDEIEGCPQIENEKAMLEQILALLPCTTNIYSLIGRPSYEIMAWANAIDTYIVPFASGITFVAKLANKVGVIHSTLGLAGTIEPTVLSMRENAVSPVVPREHIVELDAGNPVLCDYDCDWKGIYDEVVKIINNLVSNE